MARAVSIVREASPIGPVEISRDLYKFMVLPAALPGEVIRLRLGGGKHCVEVVVEEFGEYGYSIGRRSATCPTRARFVASQEINFAEPLSGIEDLPEDWPTSTE